MATTPTSPPPPPPSSGGLISPVKGISGTVRDSAYLTLARAERPPPDYGLYTVLLTRSGSLQALRVTAELLRVTPAAPDAALARENLNLLVLPVRGEHGGAAMAALSASRHLPDGGAERLLREHYDTAQAAALIAAVCRPERGAAVMRTCGSAQTDGPLLVTSYRPFGIDAPASQRLLVVNLAQVPPGALPETLAAFRRQITRRDFADRVETEAWRLTALNAILDAAQLLPGLSKAYAGTR